MQDGQQINMHGLGFFFPYNHEIIYISTSPFVSFRLNLNFSYTQHYIQIFKDHMCEGKKKKLLSQNF